MVSATFAVLLVVFFPPFIPSEILRRDSGAGRSSPWTVDRQQVNNGYDAPDYRGTAYRHTIHLLSRQRARSA